MSDLIDEIPAPEPADMTLAPAVDAATEPASNPTVGPHVAYMARRATHSSRAITTVILSLLLLAGTVFLLLELGYNTFFGKSLSGLSVEQMIHNLAILPDRVIFPWLGVGGIIAALIGLGLILKAIMPGSLNRHQMKSPRAAIIVDDSVLAAAISKEMRSFGNFVEGQVTTAIDRTTIEVTVTASPGRVVDEILLNTHLAHHVAGLDLAPAVRTKVIVVGGEVN
ncbi:hypothetical protein [Boudabousia marimammalium]|uniref:Alkaline shock response membrane anchor protein AmaP n=1 Tax=Boudabousia marimammalium TaxID=156892 RepID=A0A1Q5PSU2_9ACTO|nr:hypothetical protein [Boudabousia marimammalium]OKL50613.1 hypothetical protein BM477_01260 [Boudabousia marimammalium]